MNMLPDPYITAVAMHRSMETRVATIVRRANGLLETRFKEGVAIDMHGLLENITTRRALCGDEPHVLLTIVPASVTFGTAHMSPELFPDASERAHIKAIALVASEGVPGMMARLYFSCFPDVAITKVFSDEERAVLWLEEQLSTSNN